MKQICCSVVRTPPTAARAIRLRRGRLLQTFGALLLLLLFARPATAEPALELYQEAEVHFSMARFKKSLQLLQRAKRRAKDPELQAKIHLLLGVNLGVLKRKRQAQREFQLALKLDPSLTLDDRAVKPPIVALFEETRQQLTGTVQIADYQEGSRVMVDGAEAGRVPVELTLPVGPHRIEIRTPDNKWRGEGTLIVAFGQTQAFKVGLESIEQPEAQPPPVKPQALPEPEPVETPAPPRWRLYSGLATLSVGAGLLVTGIVYGMKVAGANDDYAAGKDNLTHMQLQAIADDAASYETIQRIALISGGVVLAAGGGLLLWHFLQSGSSAEGPSTAVAPFIGPTGFGVTSLTRF